MLKAYLAGDGLQRGNQILRNMERDAINALGTVKLFNPWDNKDINDKSNNPMAEDIFMKDTAAILESDVVVADVANTSVGTTAEMGQVWGINYMLERLFDIVRKANAEETNEDDFNHSVVRGVERLLNKIPQKIVVWQTTDIRDTDIMEHGHRRSHSINQYLYGMMLDMAGEAMSFEQILSALDYEDGEDPIR